MTTYRVEETSGEISYFSCKSLAQLAPSLKGLDFITYRPATDEEINTLIRAHSCPALED